MDSESVIALVNEVDVVMESAVVSESVNILAKAVDVVIES